MSGVGRDDGRQWEGWERAKGRVQQEKWEGRVEGRVERRVKGWCGEWLFGREKVWDWQKKGQLSGPSSRWRGWGDRCLVDITLPCIQVHCCWGRTLYILRLVEWASGSTFCLIVGVDLEVSLSLTVLELLFKLSDTPLWAIFCDVLTRPCYFKLSVMQGSYL